MSTALRHRGPDACGNIEIVGRGARLLLGHTRLSILDLSSDSDQPMKDAVTGSWLVFNGEIYNYRQLRGELETKGRQFRTTGDTEVLLQALVEWNEQALDKLEGMFAFAFWDAPRERLLLARDPLGIKPLYYSAEADEFVFASEVKAIQVANGALTLSRRGIDSFLTYGAVIGPETIYEEVREVGPGHVLTVDSQLNVFDQEYWSLTGFLANDKSSPLGFEQAVDCMRQRIESAVLSHLASDVPVGIFLSGGVDSSLLALLASKYATAPLTLLTVAFDEQEFSELAYARELAERIPHHHEVVTLSSKHLLGMLSEALSAMDQPTVDGMNTFVISRVGASLGLKVLLSGIGGDELFGGYTTFRKAPALLRYGALLKPAAGWLGAWSSNPIQWEKISQATPRDITDAYLLQRSVRWRGVECGASPEIPRRQINSLRSDFQKIAALELEFYTRNQLLRDADVFSMANAVELRVPLLDKQLVQAALTLPSEVHFDGKRGKRLSRAILGELLGGAIPNRPKMGFAFPWRQWLQRTLKSTVASTLSEEELYQPLGLEASYGRELLKGLETDDPLQSWSEVWSLFVLLNWQAKNGVECAAA
jgi:asparagine synthase (glutamine-hydrolysing)